jgi:amino acid transporter
MALLMAPGAPGGGVCSGVELAHEAAYRLVYDVVVITMTRVPYVVAMMAAVVLFYLAYRRRPRPPKWGMWPVIFAVLALYGFLAALALAGWDEPLVLLGISFAALSGYAWLDPARRRSSAGARQTSEGRGWFG